MVSLVELVKESSGSWMVGWWLVGGAGVELAMMAMWWWHDG